MSVVNLSATAADSPTTLVRPLSVIAKEINGLLVKVKQSEETRMEQVRQIGVALHEVKDRLPHGKFEAWVTKNCISPFTGKPLSRSVRNEYMIYAEETTPALAKAAGGTKVIDVTPEKAAADG